MLMKRNISLMEADPTARCGITSQEDTCIVLRVHTLLNGSPIHLA